MTDSVSTLPTHPMLWRANQQRAECVRLPTGFSKLDDKLGGGLPAHGVVRVRSALGIGELSLFSAALAANDRDKLVIFINPPGILQASWLAKIGLDHEHAYCINAPSDEDSQWAAEQCLRESVCKVVCIWSNGLSPKRARRLQVAARQNHILCLLFEPVATKRTALPVVLDLSLQAYSSGIEVIIERQQNAWFSGVVAVPTRFTPDNAVIAALMGEEANILSQSHTGN